MIYDKSLQGTNNLSCGANEDEYHYTGLCMERDIPDAEYVDVAKITEGGICPKCGKPMIKISRGIEVGNIFQLGTKYTKSMNMTYLDADGQTQTPIMGCYGIGVGRLAASVCEAHHDEYGPIWPMSIAPSLILSISFSTLFILASILIPFSYLLSYIVHILSR